jgi:hypothetical protein
MNNVNLLNNLIIKNNNGECGTVTEYFSLVSLFCFLIPHVVVINEKWF